jgi:subtilisin family serine protease
MDGATAIVTIGADIAGSRGILVVQSAGNGGFQSEPVNTLIAPGDGDSVLTVGAVTNGYVRATFSSVGLSADGRIKPDVMSLGQIVHTVSPFDETGFIDVTGTSMSCPQVAGAAALLMQARPNATNAQIMNALRQTASQANAPDRLLGWGVIDAEAAFAALPTAVAHTPPPVRSTLGPIYPNPFNPETTIEYEVARGGRVTIAVFDVGGRRVATLIDEAQAAGRRTVKWNGTGTDGAPVASGVYLIRLTADDSQPGRKVVLLK